MPAFSSNEPVSAVILAGGLARRFHGLDKGLIELHHRPLISHTLVRLQTQPVQYILINANRNLTTYQQWGYPVFSDENTGFHGPLSGMLTGLKQAKTNWVLFVPCDSPFLPLNLLEKLKSAVQIQKVLVAYAHDGKQPHPTFCLLSTQLLSSLQQYLQTGQRKLLDFMTQQQAVAVDFSEQPFAFTNINQEEDLKPYHSIPMLGITGYSGVGKTTLLKQLLPELQQRHIAVSVLKHTHHNVVLDKPGKDSWQMQQAGAKEVMIACDNRWALMVETPNAPQNLASLATKFDPSHTQLILVEGFKQEALPKLLLHRKSHRSLPQLDRYILAIATDSPLTTDIPCLDLNNISQIADFIEQWWQRKVTLCR